MIYGRELAALALPNLMEELPLIINGEKMVVAILAVFLLKKYGRKWMMLRGVFLVFVALFGLFFGFIMHSPDNRSVQIIILIFFSMYVFGFVLTMGPITWLNIP